MTKQDAIELASKFAEKQGYDVGGYDASAKKSAARWQVDFRRKSGINKSAPGDFFTVFIDDESKTVEKLIPGK